MPAETDFRKRLEELRPYLQCAAEALAARMSAYSKPPIDQGLEQALTDYVNRRKLEEKYRLTNQPLEKVA